MQVLRDLRGLKELEGWVSRAATTPVSLGVRALS